MQVIEGEGAGEETVTFLVNRATLCLSSPVFCAMLGKQSRFLKGTGAEDDERRIVDLKDDKIKAMRIFLNIIHLNHTMVPRRPSACDTDHIAVLSDKYDMREAFGLWPELWVRSLCELWNHGISEKCFNMAWTFGLTEWTKKISASLLLNTALSCDGQPVLQGTEMFIEDLEPTCLVGNDLFIESRDSIESNHLTGPIVSRRKSLVKWIQEYINRYKIKQQRGKGGCRVAGAKNSEICATVMVGQLMRSFPSDGKINGEELQKYSLSEIRSLVSEIPTQRCDSFLGPAFLKTYRDCDSLWRVKSALTDALSDLENEDLTRRYLRRHPVIV